LAGVIGALMIAHWSCGLMRDTGAILLDMSPGQRMLEDVRQAIDELVATGHAPISCATRSLQGLLHVTVEVQPAQAAA